MAQFVFVLRFIHDERGATAIEYGLIVALISLVIIAALTKTGAHTRTVFRKVGRAL